MSPSKTASLGQNRNYRLLVSSSALSNIGDGISALAFPWLATMISRDPLHIALVAFATRLPWFLVSLPAGVITDRANRQSLLVLSDVVRVLLSLGVVALILRSDSLPLPEHSTQQLSLIVGLSAIAFLLGTAEVFRDNAAQTALPSLVDSEHLEHANGQMWSVEQLMGSFVGPPLAGFLIALAIPLPFGFEAVTFALSAWCLYLIAYPMRVNVRAQTGFVDELMNGVSWIRAHRLILTLAIMLGFMNALNIMAITILVLYSQELLHLSAVGHGMLLTAGAAGGIAGGLLCPAIAMRLGQQKSLVLALFVFPLPYVAIYVTTSPIVVALALFIEMFAALLWNVVTVSYRQRLIPDDLLGRVNSIYRFFGWGMMPIGAVAGGLIVSFAENDYERETALRLPYLCAAIGSVILLVYALVKIRFPLSPR